MMDYVSRQSTVTARDILKKVIREDKRFQRIPTEADAERIAAELKWYINPAYLLEVWQECFKG